MCGIGSLARECAQNRLGHPIGKSCHFQMLSYADSLIRVADSIDFPAPHAYILALRLRPGHRPSESCVPVRISENEKLRAKRRQAHSYGDVSTLDVVGSLTDRSRPWVPYLWRSFVRNGYRRVFRCLRWVREEVKAHRADRLLHERQCIAGCKAHLRFNAFSQTARNFGRACNPDCGRRALNVLKSRGDAFAAHLDGYKRDIWSWRSSDKDYRHTRIREDLQGLYQFRRDACLMGDHQRLIVPSAFG